MPGDVALILGESVHTRAAVLVLLLGIESLLDERSPASEGGDSGGCTRGASGDSLPVLPTSEEHTDPTDPVGEPGDNDMIDMAVSVGELTIILISPVLGSATAISIGLAPARTDVAIIACATPWFASFAPS